MHLDIPLALQKPNVLHVGPTQIVAGGMKVGANIFQEKYIFAFEISSSLAMPASNAFVPSEELCKLLCSMYQNSTREAPDRVGKGTVQSTPAWLLSLLFETVFR